MARPCTPSWVETTSRTHSPWLTSMVLGSKPQLKARTRTSTGTASDETGAWEGGDSGAGKDTGRGSRAGAGEGKGTGVGGTTNTSSFTFSPARKDAGGGSGA